jgi:hypothetical protein
MRRLAVVLFPAAFVACKPGPAVSDPSAPSPSSAECAQTLPPRVKPHVPAPHGPSREAAPSRIVAELEAPLSAFAAELEKRVGTRVAEGNDIGLGPAGTLKYTLDRGPFSVSVADRKLVVQTEVQARAEACSRGRCYASCEPRATVRAQVSLALREDYRFERTRVTATFTRGCKVRVLGGFLTVDVTPTIESALAPELERAGRDIDAQLPDVHAEAERAFRQMSEGQRLPLGGCIEVQPLALIQGPIEDSKQFLRARFGVLARPELRPECSEASTPPPLPPLKFDRSMPNESVATLGMVMPLESVGRAFTLPPGTTTRHRVSRAGVTAAGSDVDLDLSLQGAVCGDLSLRAAPVFTGDGQQVTLSATSFASGERERVIETGADPAELGRELAALARVPVPLSPQSLGAALPLLTAAFSNRNVRIATDVSDVRAAGAAARGEELVAWTEVRGRLRLTVSP